MGEKTMHYLFKRHLKVIWTFHGGGIFESEGIFQDSKEGYLLSK